MVAAPLWPSKMLRVVNLFLDGQNIRLDVQHLSQDAILQDLFLNEGAMQIVESILRNGFFNTELPVVTKEADQWIVLEGNRRIAALKAMLNPKSVPSFEKRIVKLIGDSNANPIEEIEVRVSASREEAQRYISSIHTAQSRRPWRPLRQAYFYHAQIEGGNKSIEQLIEEYPSVDIPKFVKMWEMQRIISAIEYGDETTQRSVNSRSFKITTLERLYDSEKFRNHFGIAFDQVGRVSITADKEEFEKSLAPVIRDIVHSRIDSRKINNEQQLNEHLKRWEAPKVAEVGKQTSSAAFNPVPIPPRRKTGKHLIPKDVACTLTNVGVQRRLAELQALDYQRFPMATLDSLRSLLECALKAYCAHAGVVPKAGRDGFVQLDGALVAVLQHFETQNVRRDLVAPIKQIRDRQQMYSLKLELDSINHNPHIFSVPSEVKSAWDRIDALMRFLLNPV